MKYKTEKFIETRLASIDVCEIGRKKHHVKALLEVDVTLAREKLRILRREKKQQVSFLAWFLKILSNTAKKHEHIHAYYTGRRKLTIIENIDINLVVERKFKTQMVPLAYAMRKVNEKGMDEIHQEIAEVRTRKLNKNDAVLSKPVSFAEKLYFHLPAFIRRKIFRFMLNNPRIAHKRMGTINVTSLGMFGQIQGWMIPISANPFQLALGAITKKPGVFKNKIQIRDILHLTLLIDHDVIDGAPAARFVNEFVKKLENAEGL